jgi:hypothetical protein
MRQRKVHVAAHSAGTMRPDNPFEISTCTQRIGAIAQGAVFSLGIGCPQPDTCCVLSGSSAHSVFLRVLEGGASTATLQKLRFQLAFMPALPTPC